MITRINHAQVTVPRGRIEDVRAFFGTTLGLREIPPADAVKHLGVIWFRIGERDELHVGQEDGIDREKTNAHLAFEVDDIAAWRRKLLAAGFQLIDQPVITGYDRFHLRDPFGNKHEFIGKTG